MTTWRTLITDAMDASGDTWLDVVSMAPEGEAWLDVEFDAGYGGAEGVPFTVWTYDYVYFPFEYDGSDNVGCVARNPNGKPTDHQ